MIFQKKLMVLFFSKKRLFIFFFTFFHLSFSQEMRLQNGFKTPLEIPITISKHFGELQRGHFHPGIDIETTSPGEKIYTIKKGYVYKISISPFYYGKSVFIKHPDGYTSVYAHLKRFNKKIEQYIKKKQYEKKSFEIEIFPKKEELQIENDELIAYSGNTGNSFKPHLHFEIRNHQTKKMINPSSLLNLKQNNRLPPEINGLIAIPFGEKSAVNKLPIQQEIQIKKINRNLYVSDEIDAIGKIGLMINIPDFLENKVSKNEVYSIETVVDGQTIFYYDFKSLSFDDDTYIDYFIDYEYYFKYKKIYQKLYVEKDNRLSIYQKLKDDGFLNVRAEKNYNIKILIKNIHGDKTTLKIKVKGINVIRPILKKRPSTPFLVKRDTFAIFKEKNIELRFPKKTFYQDTFINFSVEGNLIQISKPHLSLNKNYTVTYFTDTLTQKEKDYLYFSYERENKDYYVKTYKKNDKIYIHTKKLGNFYLKYDSISPIVYGTNFYENQDVTNLKSLEVYVKDEENILKSYQATIDQKWILMEYDPKKKKLSFDLNDLENNDTYHHFKLSVQDMLGNLKVFKSNFYK